MQAAPPVEVSTVQKNTGTEPTRAVNAGKEAPAHSQMAVSRAPPPPPPDSAANLPLRPEQILYLQRMRGNRHVQRQVERRLSARDPRGKPEATSDLVDDHTGDAPSEGGAASLVLSVEPPREPTASNLVIEDLAAAEGPPVLPLSDGAAEPAVNAPQSDITGPTLPDAISAGAQDQTRDAPPDFRDIAANDGAASGSDKLVVQRWSLGGIVESVAGTLSSAAEGALAGIRSRIEGVVGGLQSGWNRLTAMASGVARTVSQGLQAAGDRLRSLASAAVSGLRSGWSALQEGASSLAQGVISRIQGGLQTVTGSIGAIAQAIINLDARSLQAAWNRLRALLGGVWQQAQTLARGLTQRMATLWNSLRARFTSIGRSLADAARSIVNQLRSISEAVRNQIVAAWNGLQERARELGGIAGGIMRAIQAVVERLVSFARRIWDGIASGWAALQERLGAAIQSIGSRISDIIGQLRRQAQSVWAGIAGLFGRLRAWAARQMDRALSGVRVLWNAIRNFGIGQLIDTIIKCAPFLRAVRDAVQNPDSVLRPIAQAIAAKISEAMPARAEQVARARVAGRGTESALTPKATSGGPVVQRSVDHMLIQRQALEQPIDQGTLWRGFWFVLTEKWNEFWANPIANILHILWDLIAFWETVPRDLRGLVSDLERACERMTTLGLGFWRHLIDIPLIILRRVNQILLDLFPLFVLLSTAVGAIAGGIGGTVGGAILTFMAGGAGAAPGAGGGIAGGAGVGFGFAMGVGEGLLVSYITVELLTAVKAWADLSFVEQTEKEQAEDLDQMVSSSIGAAIAGILWLISAIGGQIAKRLKINLRPGGAAQRFFEGVKRGFRGGSPFRRGRVRVIEIDSPSGLRASEPVYQNGRWEWNLYDAETGARFCTIYAEAPSAAESPTGGPRLTLTPKEAVMPDGEIVNLQAKGFSWTPESLRLAIESYQRKFGVRPPELGGEIDWSNLANFQFEYAGIRAANPGMSPDAIGIEAAKKISFGKHRITVGYGDFSVRMSNFGDVKVNVKGQTHTLVDVPKDVYIEARPTSGGGTPGGGANQ